MALGDGIRRNIATVSQEERDRLRDAIIKLQTQQHYPGVRGDSPVGGVSHWFKQDEIHANSHVHNCPAFVPWHREFVNRMELLIREIDPQLSLHYWDWTQDPRQLPDGQGGQINLFDAGFFGQPNGQYPGEPMQAANSPYRPDGFYVPDANPYRSDIPGDPAHDNPFDPPLDLPYAVGGGGLVADDTAALTAPTYLDFHNAINASHGTAHGFIGGILGDPHTSFRSPVAFLLHANLDRIFAMWQRRPGLPARVVPASVYDRAQGDPGFTGWFQDPEKGVGDLAVSDFPWWGFSSPLMPWAGPGAQDVNIAVTGKVLNVAPVRPWVPTNFAGVGGPFENEQTYKDSRDPSIVFPPSYDTVPHSAYFILDRSTFSSYEVAANASFPAATTLIYDGFTPNELGGNPPALPTLQVTFDSANGADASGSITVTAEAGLLEGPGLDTPQRITFAIDVQFTDQTIFNGFLDTRNINLRATHGATVTDTGFELTKQPSPYMLDGSPYWLSTDTRLFKLKPGETLAHSTTSHPAPNVAPPAVDQNAPLTYISNLLAEMRTSGGPGEQIFQGISPDEQASGLEASQTEGGAAVYNYAIAKVRYRANTVDAANVQVFFRTFSTMRSALDYSYSGNNPPAINYTRSGAWHSGVPLLGLIDGEVASIPYFATARVDSTAQSMTLQPVDALNVQTIGATGQETTMFFGCWLDFNQPTPRFPFTPSGNGPFSGAQSIPAVINGLHECMVAEVFFQPGGGQDPIPSGSTPASSDRLAQRNIAFLPSGNPGGGATHTVQHTFMLKPSRVQSRKGVDERYEPDELMIRWNDLPAATKVTLYVPEWDSDEVMQLAAHRQGPNVLHKVDAHTLAIDVAADVAFVPIPSRATKSYAGLITLETPLGVRVGESYTVDLHQYSSIPTRFNGAFRIVIPIQSDETLLPLTIRNLALLRYIAQARPKNNRWQPIFSRWISGLVAKVVALGGDPNQVPPSLTDPGTAVNPIHRESYLSGKIARIFYDCFGDFESFELDDCGERHRFHTGEHAIEEVVRRACRDRSRLTVRFEAATHRIVGLVIECASSS